MYRNYMYVNIMVVFEFLIVSRLDFGNASLLHICEVMRGGSDFRQKNGRVIVNRMNLLELLNF